MGMRPIKLIQENIINLTYVLTNFSVLVLIFKLFNFVDSIGTNHIHFIENHSNIFISIYPLKMLTNIKNLKNSSRTFVVTAIIIVKYWLQRQTLFHRFKNGVKMDFESFFSV